MLQQYQFGQSGQFARTADRGTTQLSDLAAQRGPGSIGHSARFSNPAPRSESQPTDLFSSELDRALFPAPGERRGGPALTNPSEILQRLGLDRSGVGHRAVQRTAVRLVDSMHELDAGIEDRIRARLRALEDDRSRAAHEAEERSRNAERARAAQDEEQEERARSAERAARQFRDVIAGLLARLDRDSGDESAEQLATRERPDAAQSPDRRAVADAAAAARAAEFTETGERDDTAELDLEALEQLLRLIQTQQGREGRDAGPNVVTLDAGAGERGVRLEAFSDLFAGVFNARESAAQTEQSGDTERLQALRQLLASIERVLGTSAGEEQAGVRATRTDASETASQERTALLRLIDGDASARGEGEQGATEGSARNARAETLNLERIAELVKRLREDGAGSEERVQSEAVARLRAALERKDGAQDDTERKIARMADRESEREEAGGDRRVRVRDLRSRGEARGDTRGEARSQAREERAEGARGARAAAEGAGRASGGRGEAGRSEFRLERTEGGDTAADRAAGLRSGEAAAATRQAPLTRFGAQQQAEAQLARHIRNELPEQVLKQARMVIRGDNDGEMRLSLNPPELGGVRVRMQIQDNLIAVRFIVENNSVRDVFEQNMPSLQQQLAENGFENAGIEVSVGGNSDANQEGHATGEGGRGLEELDAGVPTATESYREETRIDLMV